MNDSVEKVKLSFWSLLVWIFVASLFRLIPHPPNFTPLLSIALLGGVYFEKKTFSFLLTFLVIFLTDLIIGLHSLIWAVYLSLTFIICMGFFLRKKVGIISVLLISCLSSVVFFLITNFGVWLTYDMYSKTFSGLMACYVVALPFFHNTLLSCLFYSSVLFFSFSFFRRKVLILNTQKSLHSLNN